MIINLCLEDKEQVKRVCEKSKKLTGSKWKWKKIADRRGTSLQQMEEFLDRELKEQEEFIAKLREKYVKKEETKG
jgi:hypothetical protein